MIKIKITNLFIMYYSVFIVLNKSMHFILNKSLIYTTHKKANHQRVVVTSYISINIRQLIQITMSCYGQLIM